MDRPPSKPRRLELFSADAQDRRTLKGKNGTIGHDKLDLFAEPSNRLAWDAAYVVNSRSDACPARAQPSHRVRCQRAAVPRGRAGAGHSQLRIRALRDCECRLLVWRAGLRSLAAF